MMTAGANGPRLSSIIAVARRGAPKVRKQTPPTIAVADEQATVATTQSPLVRLTKPP